MSDDTFSSDHFVTINGIEIRGGVPNATITIKSKEEDPIYDMCKSFATEHGIEFVPMKIEDSHIIIKREEDSHEDFTYDSGRMLIACSSDIEMKPKNITKEQFLSWMKEKAYKHDLRIIDNNDWIEDC